MDAELINLKPKFKSAERLIMSKFFLKLTITLSIFFASSLANEHVKISPVISGSRPQNEYEKSHIDPLTGKIKRKRIVRKKNFLFLNLKNIDKAVRNTEYLVLFVFGNWCSFAKKHLESFKKLATFHETLHSKLLFGKLHIARKEQFIYSDIRSNPTIILFHRGHKIEEIDFSKKETHILALRPRILNAFRLYLIHDVADEGHLRGMVKAYERFLIFVSDKPLDETKLYQELEYKNEGEGIDREDRAITNEKIEIERKLETLDGSDQEVIGIKNDDSTSTQNEKKVLESPQELVTFSNYLKMSDMRFGMHVTYFSYHSAQGLQSLFPEVDVQSGHVYLFRQKDNALIRVGLLDMHHPGNWFDLKSWLYHHINPHVLSYPEPARQQILKNHNMALMLFMPGTKENLDDVQTANESAELELDIAAKELYK